MLSDVFFRFKDIEKYSLRSFKVKLRLQFKTNLFKEKELYTYDFNFLKHTHELHKQKIY